MPNKSSTRTAHNLAKVWQEYRGISIVPSFGAIEPTPDPRSTWKRVMEFFTKPDWSPWRKQKKAEAELELKDINEDVTVIYAKFSGRPEFNAQFVSDKLKELDWSLVDIQKLGVRFKDIK